MAEKSWKKIFSDHGILRHDFEESPFELTAEQIKSSCQDFKKTGEKEVRVLCKQDTRESVPQIMSDNGLFLLPVRNGKYVLVKGEGYFDIPDIKTRVEVHRSKLNFELKTSKVGNSEMQHLDYAYATSIIRTFFDDDGLILTIRGRKYTPKFSFSVGRHEITVKSVQTEVDAGYESADKVVLVEAKNSKSTNSIIRQLFYPFRSWSESLRHSKKVFPVFFERRGSEYLIWQYDFSDKNQYNSIKLVKSRRFRIIDKPEKQTP